MGVINFNGVSTDQLGITVELAPDYEIPERAYDIVEVPGRNGSVIIDTGAYKNVDRAYKIAIGKEDGDFGHLSSRIVDWIYSAHGYKRLEDTYEPNYYKMATIVQPSTVYNLLQQAGRTTLVFNRKPQRFLKIGDNPIELTSNNTINNPTNQIAKPLITIECGGSGEVLIGNQSIKIEGLTTGYITIDCDLQECYHDKLNLNNKVTLSNKEYPGLLPGNNNIRINGNITKVTIIPRWWTI